MRPKGKFGLRSGNTFRFGGQLSSSGKTLQYSSDQNVVVKTLIDADSTPTDVDWRRFTRHQAEQLAGPGRDLRRLIDLLSG